LLACGVDPLRAAPQRAAGQDAGAEVAADLVADAVAEDRGADDHGQHDRKGCVAEAGGDTAEHGRGFAGQHEADEQRVFGEDE
jgi:hypothetical protein